MNERTVLTSPTLTGGEGITVHNSPFFKKTVQSSACVCSLQLASLVSPRSLTSRVQGSHGKGAENDDAILSKRCNETERQTERQLMLTYLDLNVSGSDERRPVVGPSDDDEVVHRLTLSIQHFPRPDDAARLVHVEQAERVVASVKEVTELVARRKITVSCHRRTNLRHTKHPVCTLDLDFSKVTYIGSMRKGRPMPNIYVRGHLLRNLLSGQTDRHRTYCCTVKCSAKSMSVLVILGRKWTLAASRAALW